MSKHKAGQQLEYKPKVEELIGYDGRLPYFKINWKKIYEKLEKDSTLSLWQLLLDDTHIANEIIFILEHTTDMIDVNRIFKRRIDLQRDDDVIELILNSPNVIRDSKFNQLKNQYHLNTAKLVEEIDSVINISQDKLDGSKALLNAIERNDIESAELLLSAGNIMINEHELYKRLLDVFYIHDPNMLKVFINSSRIDPDMLLDAACHTGDISVVEEFLQEYDFTVKQKSGALILAARSIAGNEVAYSIVKLLLSNAYDPPADPTYHNNQALIYATKLNNLDIVDMLLDFDNVNPSDQKKRSTWSSY